MGTGSTMSWRQLVPPAPALTSLHTLGTQQGSSPQFLCRRLLSPWLSTDMDKWPFPDYPSLLHIPIYLRQPQSSMRSPRPTSDGGFKFSTRKHQVPPDCDSRDQRWEGWKTFPCSTAGAATIHWGLAWCISGCTRTTLKYQKFKFSSISVPCFTPFSKGFKNTVSKRTQAFEFPVKPVPYFKI